MRLLTIAGKDLLQIVRDWKSVLFLVIMPIAFTTFFAFVLDPVYQRDAKRDPRLSVGWYEAYQQTTMGQQSVKLTTALRALAAGSPSIQLEEVNEEGIGQAERAVARGKLAALVIVPSEYDRSLLEGQPITPTVVVDSNTPAGNTALRAVETATTRLNGAVTAARISTKLYEEKVGFDSDEKRWQYLLEGIRQVLAGWEDPPLSAEKAPFLSDGAENLPVMTSLIQASSGMMIQFTIFGLITAAMVLVLERKSGALQRLRATPMRPAGIIGGHVSAMFIVIMAQQAILVSFGQLVFGVNYLRAPAAILLMMTALSLWGASLGLLISAISRREEQVVIFSLVAMFFFSALGGAWFPLEITGATFAAIGRFTPTAWAIEGLQNVILRGLGIRSVLLPMGIVLAYAAGFFTLAVWRFSRV